MDGAGREALTMLSWALLTVLGGIATWFGMTLFLLTTSHSGLASPTDWVVNTGIFAAALAFTLYSAGRWLRAVLRSRR